jgi:hypothetical protein
MHAKVKAMALDVPKIPVGHTSHTNSCRKQKIKILPSFLEGGPCTELEVVFNFTDDKLITKRRIQCHRQGAAIWLSS